MQGGRWARRIDKRAYSTYSTHLFFLAQMAELVDALASGASVLMDVEVRVLFWAPLHQIMLI